MAFELHKSEYTRSSEPAVTVCKDRMLSLNAAARKQCLNGCRWADLYYDDDTRTAAIKFRSEPGTYSRRVTVVPSSRGRMTVRISAKSFCREHSIPNRTIQRPLAFNEKRGFWVFTVPLQ